MKIKDLPQPYRELSLKNQERQGNPRNEKIDLNEAFDFKDAKEGPVFWAKVYLNENPPIPQTSTQVREDMLSNMREAVENLKELPQEMEINTQPHYDNTKGSLYKIAQERGWNAYQFDIVKRIDRCEKKGQFNDDLDKTIEVIKMYKKGV